MHEAYFTLDVKADDSLKVKRRTLIITSYEASLNSKGIIKEEEQTSSNYILVQGADDLKVEVEPADALEKIVNEQGYQYPTNGKLLKNKCLTCCWIRP